MSIENAGIGAGSGLLGAFLAFFRLRDDIKDVKKSVETLAKKVVYQDVCSVCGKSTHDRLDRIEDKIDRLLDRGRP